MRQRDGAAGPPGTKHTDVHIFTHPHVLESLRLISASRSTPKPYDCEEADDLTTESLKHQRTIMEKRAECNVGRGFIKWFVLQHVTTYIIRLHANCHPLSALN